MTENLRFSGKDGKSYMFEVYPKNTKFNNVIALYAFLAQQPANRYQVLYIGKTIKLGERINGHEKWPEVNRLGCTHIAVCRDTSLLTLDSDEENLIKNYNPACNEQLTDN